MLGYALNDRYIVGITLIFGSVWPALVARVPAKPAALLAPRGRSGAPGTPHPTLKSPFQHPPWA